MRSMARLEDGSDQALVEAKAVDAAYPLYGALVTEPALPREELFGERNGVFGAAAADLLFERLGIAPGQRIKLGTATFELRAKIITEPDAASDGFGFAPRLMVSLEGLAASGLVQPGSLVEHAYKVRLDGQPTEAELDEIRERAGEEFPEAGWSIRTRLQRRAVAVGQYRALLAVPDAGRADRAGRRRRRRRQCGARLSRRKTRRHRHLQEPRRVGRLRLHRLSDADLDHRRHRHRDRAGARRADALRGAGGARLGHPGSGRGRGLSGSAGHGGAVRRARDARLRIASARARARRAGDRAFPRDGFRGRRAAAQTLCLCGGRHRDPACAARCSVLRRPAHRDDLRRRGRLLLHRAAKRRPAGAVAGAKKPARAFGRAAGWRSATSIAPAR